MRITQEYSDKTAIGLSVLCLLHCLLVPTFLVFLSGYISLSYNNEIVHYILLLIAIPVSIYALIAGARNHKSINFLYLGFTGILFLILAVTLGALMAWFRKIIHDLRYKKPKQEGVKFPVK